MRMLSKKYSNYFPPMMSKIDVKIEFMMHASTITAIIDVTYTTPKCVPKTPVYYSECTIRAKPNRQETFLKVFTSFDEVR